ncbi:hypothetical protein DD238_000781 [Peronospora effusa]|uniref:GH18 domain-containing protein n=1 Tax=Peronospora effusa TaxID=542832 RepID=A0A3M6VM23_9STRA|nr:hypothetical protein DD238_000781 [Peronospora effusa]RQM17358.1 hypothetical protein DD237_001351 [Peronospora effusa]
MGPSYLSSSLNQRAIPKTKQSSKLLKFLVPIFCGVVVIIIIVVIALHAKSSDGSSTSGEGDGNAASSSSSTLSSSCARVDPKDRTVAFWQSEVAGCDTVPEGVTHFVFGFALVMEESAVALLTKFRFDGLDLDDETVGAQFSADRTVGLLKATREALDAAGNTSALLTYDAYFTEGDTSVCTAAESAAYSRCFPTKVLEYVDWVNIMAYNIDKDNDTAAAIYAAAVNTTFAAWGTQLGGNFSLATIGLCVEGGCAYGPGPNATVIAEWKEFARQDGHGGMMIYAASTEVAEDFPVTRSIISTT